MKRVWALILLVALPCLGTGCSLVLSNPPPRNRDMVHYDECKSGSVPVVLDVIGAVNAGSLSLIFLGGAALINEQQNNETVASWNLRSKLEDSKRVWLGLGVASLVLTTLHIHSAGYGTQAREDCNQARIRLYQQFQQTPPQQPPPPPWPAR